MLSALVAWLITAPEPPQNMSLLVWAVLTVVTVGLFGITPGQAALGIRVVPIGGGSFVGAWALPRTALIFLIVPPLLVNVGRARAARPALPDDRAADPLTRLESGRSRPAGPVSGGAWRAACCAA